ncbi:FixJ family two-component response regulator [Microvirga flocculans]|uniref:FixJ family two-component response regulator n=1 Tax=Microvirga flocculans TaxID=217168 RepID=A0A7W6IE64_9HYPH|nr:response regulator [Microvirga flocculans]MBB4039837.1 FixJ family two-component response regulator [Microvirga flocculans]
MSELAERVLVVDGDLAVRSSLKFALEVEGLAVRAYESGAELLSDPDLPREGCLVMDFHLPGMSGIDLLRRLEERQLHYSVIFITSGMAHRVLECRAEGDSFEVLEKPLEHDVLLDRIHVALAASARRWA